MEKFPDPSNFENREKESPEEKHQKWMNAARATLEGIVGHAIALTSAYYILKSLGVELPIYLIAGGPTPATLLYINERTKNLNKK